MDFRVPIASGTVFIANGREMRPTTSDVPRMHESMTSNLAFLLIDHIFSDYRRGYVELGVHQLQTTWTVWIALFVVGNVYHNLCYLAEIGHAHTFLCWLLLKLSTRSVVIGFPWTVITIFPLDCQGTEVWSRLPFPWKNRSAQQDNRMFLSIVPQTFHGCPGSKHVGSILWMLLPWSILQLLWRVGLITAISLLWLMFTSVCNGHFSGPYVSTDLVSATWSWPLIYYGMSLRYHICPALVNTLRDTALYAL